jgi:hypothetical protein
MAHSELDERRQLLARSVVGLFEPQLPGDQLRAAVEEYLTNTGLKPNIVSGAESKTPAELAGLLVARAPAIPDSFYETWAARFADWAVGFFLPDRLDKMTDGSMDGHAFLLIEFFEFLRENDQAVSRDLKQIVDDTDGSVEELKLLLGAEATARR